MNHVLILLLALVGLLQVSDSDLVLLVIPLPIAQLAFSYQLLDNLIWEVFEELFHSIHVSLDSLPLLSALQMFMKLSWLA